jgi:hypothetical protein
VAQGAFAPGGLRIEFPQCGRPAGRGPPARPKRLAQGVRG